MTELLTGEVEAEEKFYSEVFAEEEDDVDFEALPRASRSAAVDTADTALGDDDDDDDDIVDSDFAASSSEDEEESIEGRADRELARADRQKLSLSKKTRSVYVDPHAKATKSAPLSGKGKARAKSAKRPRMSTAVHEADNIPEEKVLLPVEPQAVDAEADDESAHDAQGAGNRKSSRVSTKIKSAELEKKLKKSVHQKRTARKVVYHEPTQDEILKEAEQTASLNRESLQQLIKIEEEQKKKTRLHTRTQYTGPVIRFRSFSAQARVTNGDSDSNDMKKPLEEKQVVTFTQTDNFPDYLFGKPVTYPAKQMCTITGLPAKYRDPLTGLPFANATAFSVLRGRHHKTTTKGNDMVTRITASSPSSATTSAPR